VKWQARLAIGVGRLTLDVDLEGDARPAVLIGPNGSGKTTILRTIAGAHPACSGHIRLGDRVVYDSVSGVDLPPEGRRVGYVPQGYGLFPHLRVIDNVAFGWRGDLGRDRKLGRAAATELLEQLGCSHLAHRWPRSLSGGEGQRVALARALMIDPQILLLDEPLSAMDAPARRDLRGHLADHLAARQAPALVVTQDVRDVTALGAAVFALEGGRIVQRGTAAELAAHPATEFVAEFFGAA
jgi:ABC-type sulfate/molybdate transport systems ATPase subunit